MRRYHERISLRDVAAAVNLSAGHLTTVVRRKTGRTVQEWIAERRMAQARRLLVETDLTVAEIGRRVGYADPVYFSTVLPARPLQHPPSLAPRGPPLAAARKRSCAPALSRERARRREGADAGCGRRASAVPSVASLSPCAIRGSDARLAQQERVAAMAQPPVSPPLGWLEALGYVDRLTRDPLAWRGRKHRWSSRIGGGSPRGPRGNVAGHGGRIVVFGATGYAGDLTARTLVERGTRPVLAARNEDRVRALAHELGCLEWAVADVERPELTPRNRGYRDAAGVAWSPAVSPTPRSPAQRQLTPLGEQVDRLYRAAWALCGSRDAAEDLLQETFMRVLRRPRLRLRLRSKDDLGYLLRALHNTYLRERERGARQPVP
jgi:AraC-like DNA-binding protein